MSADIQSRLASIAQLTYQTYALAVERAKALELPVAAPPLPASAFRAPPSVVPPSRMAPSFVTQSEPDDILRRILVARQAEHPDSRCGATPAAVPSAKEPAPSAKKVAAVTVAKPAAEGGSPISVDNWAQRSKQIAQLMMANEAREMEARERLAQAKKRLKERHILPTTGLALPDLPKASPTASAQIEARIWKAAIESPLNADGLGKKPTLEELKEFGIVPSMAGSLSPALKDFEGTLGDIDYDDYDDDGEDDDEDDEEDDEEEDVPAAAAPAGAPLTEPKRGKKPKNGKVQAELEEVDSLLAELENSDSGKNVEAGGLSKAAAKRAKKKAKEAGAVADVPAAAAAAAAAAEPEGRNGAGEDADESPGAAADETAGKSAEEIKVMIKAKAAAAAKKKSSGAKGVAASAQQAAAAAAKERANAKKKKNDKSHYNQTPG